MKPRQILYLLLGIMFLIGGIFMLTGVPGSEQAAGTVVTESVSVQSPEAAGSSLTAETGTADAQKPEETLAPGKTGTVFDQQNEDNSKFTQFLIWLTNKNIPVWVYVVVFIALLFALRIGEYQMRVREIELHEQRMKEREEEDARIEQEKKEKEKNKLKEEEQCG